MIARHSTQSTDKYVSISESSISSPAPQRDSCSFHPLGKSILAGYRFAHCSALDRLYAPKLTFFEVRMSSWVHFAICVWAWRVHLERSLRQTWTSPDRDKCAMLEFILSFGKYDLMQTFCECSKKSSVFWRIFFKTFHLRPKDNYELLCTFLERWKTPGSPGGRDGETKKTWAQGEVSPRWEGFQMRVQMNLSPPPFFVLKCFPVLRVKASRARRVTWRIKVASHKRHQRNVQTMQLTFPFISCCRWKGFFVMQVIKVISLFFCTFVLSSHSDSLVNRLQRPHKR